MIMEAAAELLIAGAFLVDMSLNGSPVPSFKNYDWKHAAIICLQRQRN